MKIFNSVAQMKLATIKAGQFVETFGYYTIGDAGAAKYLVVAAQAADGYGDHTLANGTVAVLQADNDLNVLQFGAKGDGSDDSDAIQAALTANLTVYFPSGVYHITRALILRNSQKAYGNATIKIMDGAYTDTNFWIMTNTTKPIPYNYDAGVSFVQHIRIEGLKFDGNASGASMTGNVGAIFLDQADFCAINNVSISNINQGGGGCPGIRLFYCNKVTVSNCDIKNTDRQGIQGYESNFTVMDCFIQNSKEREPLLCSTHDPVQYQSGSMDAIRCKLINTTTTSGSHVVRFSGLTNGSVRDCDIVGLNTLNGIYITFTDFHRIEASGNTISNCLYGVLVEATGPKDLSFIGNAYVGCVNGIRVNAVSVGGIVKVVGEVIEATTQPIYLNFMDKMIVRDCDISSGTSALFVSGYKSLIFRDNIFTNMTSASQVASIQGASQTSPSVVQGNITAGNTADALRVDALASIAGNSARINGAGGAEVHFVSMGDTYLWSNSGVIYTKSFSYPTSLTDGTIVGTQT